MATDERNPDATPFIDGQTIAEFEGREDADLPEGQVDPETFVEEHDPRLLDDDRYPADFAVDFPAPPRGC